MLIFHLLKVIINIEVAEPKEALCQFSFPCFFFTGNLWTDVFLLRPFFSLIPLVFFPAEMLKSLASQDKADIQSWLLIYDPCALRKGHINLEPHPLQSAPTWRNERDPTTTAAN